MSSFPTSAFTADDRLFVRARIALCVFLALLTPLLVSSGTGLPNGRADLVMYLFLLVLLSSVTAAQWVDLKSNGRLDPSVIMWTLVPDVLSVVGMTYLFAAFGDAFYMVVVLLPVGYALVVSRTHAVIAALASAVAYVVGYAFVIDAGALELLLMVTKAAGVPLITTFVAVSVGKRDARGEVTAQAAAENQTKNDQLLRNISQLRAVARITEIVHSSLDLDGVSTDILEVLAEVIKIDTCSLLVIDKERSETPFSASLGEVSKDHIPVTGDMELLGDAPFSCVPVFEDPRALVLFCASASDIEELDEDDRVVLSAVASELVVGVDNSRLYRLTRHMAVTDELTGLYNYRYLQQRLDEEIGRARRYSSHLSLLMIDADDFKGYNDAYGHVAGDVALGELAQVFRSVVREIDIVTRYGGEEFSIALPQTDSAGAFVVAEKVREAVRTHQFRDDEGQACCSLTVSIGLATYPTHARTKDDLLREADDALYRAKNGGKDRVRTPRRQSPTEQPAADEDFVLLDAASGSHKSDELVDEWNGD